VQVEAEPTQVAHGGLHAKICSLFYKKLLLPEQAVEEL